MAVINVAEYGVNLDVAGHRANYPLVLEPTASENLPFYTMAEIARAGGSLLLTNPISPVRDEKYDGLSAHNSTGGNSGFQVGRANLVDRPEHHSSGPAVDTIIENGSANGAADAYLAVNTIADEVIGDAHVRDLLARAYDDAPPAPPLDTDAMLAEIHNRAAQQEQ
jgi:hypothetical protein